MSEDSFKARIAIFTNQIDSILSKHGITDYDNLYIYPGFTDFEKSAILNAMMQKLKIMQEELLHTTNLFTNVIYLDARRHIKLKK
jgi:hypothetical protein